MIMQLFSFSVRHGAQIGSLDIETTAVCVFFCTQKMYVNDTYRNMACMLGRGYSLRYCHQ